MSKNKKPVFFQVCFWCKSPHNVRRNGYTPGGAQRFWCNSCQKGFTGKPQGRPKHTEKTLTKQEINSRYRRQHLKIHLTCDGKSACGLSPEDNLAGLSLTNNPSEVTCKACMRTKYFKKQIND